jgi:spermidine synthase
VPRVPARRALVLALFFASGFAGLVYQVLWMRELGRLFGNTSQAAATTLAAFFLGLAAGSHAMGRRASSLRRPLLAYAALEAGIAVSAMLYFAIERTYAALYAPLYAWLGPRPGAFLAVKFALALAALLPPAFCMGGTLPALSQHLVRGADALGRAASGLYALNTLGAALGAWLAAFVLVEHLGVYGAYAVAVATSLAVAALAAHAAREALPAAAPAPAAERASVPEPALGAGALRALAFASGFATLALEVLWTRMFAQVLQNSVYTFALVLVVFLVSLAAGAGLARALMRRGVQAAPALVALLLAGAAAIAATPWLFVWETDGLAYLGGESGFAGYLLHAGSSAALVLLPAGVLAGSVFPFLLRLAEALGRGAGRTVGELAAVNLLGSVAGSLAAGFVLLDALGLWPSLRLVAVLYALAALLVAVRAAGPRPLLAAASAAALLALAVRVDPAGLPRVSFDPEGLRERLVEVFEGSGGTVAVIDRAGFLRMKLDNHYGLGGTDDLEQEERQALLPLALHPAPRAAFFLGLGSGITAGAALRLPLARVVAAELSPEVVRAARGHFGPWLHGLFADPRASVVAEDGRNLLFGTRERFDVIVSDLFLPWQRGAGSLYSAELYRAGRERLAPGGLFAQWVALFQLSREEFAAIAHTMAEVFPQLTLWRGSFRASRPIALLVGSVDAAPLDPAAVRRSLAAASGPEAAARDPRAADPAQILLLYQGNLRLAAELVADAPVETDARPRLEYRAAVAQREKRAGRAHAFVGRPLADFYEAIFERIPPESDPYLARVGAEQRELPRAGLALLRRQALEQAGDAAGAAAARERFEAIWRRASPRAPAISPRGNRSSSQRKSVSGNPHARVGPRRRRGM